MAALPAHSKLPLIYHSFCGPHYSFIQFCVMLGNSYYAGVNGRQYKRNRIELKYASSTFFVTVVILLTKYTPEWFTRLW